MNRIVIVLISMILTLTQSCAYKQTISTGSSTAYLSFNGNFENAIVVIDNETEISLMGYSNKKEVLFEVSPGKHNISIMREGKRIVNRDVLLGAGVKTEINVP